MKRQKPKQDDLVLVDDTIPAELFDNDVYIKPDGKCVILCRLINDKVFKYVSNGSDIWNMNENWEIDGAPKLRAAETKSILEFANQKISANKTRRNNAKPQRSK